MSQNLENYIKASKDAGCPIDQLRNFLRSEVVLQPRQLAASAAARACDKEDGPTEIGYGGARGGGKSHWGLAQVGCDDCQRVPELKFLYLRKVGKSGKEAIQDLRREVFPATPHEYKTQDNLILFPNGSRIVLGHFRAEKDIDNYLGIQYDGALIEEATQLSARKIKDISTCVRTSKPTELWRPRKYFTTNPGNIGHAWFKSKFIEPMRKGSETKTRFIQATVRDNSFVNSEYRDELESLTGWQRRAWLDGDWDIAAGQYFTTFRRDIHGIKPFPVPEDWRVWLALDYGFSHYTICYLFGQDNDGNVFAIGEHAARGRLVDYHAERVRSLIANFGVNKNRIRQFVTGRDCFQKNHHGGTVADDYRANGWVMTPANMDRLNGAAEVLRRLGDVDNGKRPTVFIFDTCPMLLECLPSLQHDPHRPEDVLKVDCDEDGLGGDDAYDAFRYGIMAASRSEQKVYRIKRD